MGTCKVCRGAIPDGEASDGHTALCAEVVRSRYDAVAKAAKLVSDAFSPKEPLVLAESGREMERRMVALRVELSKLGL